MVNAGFLVLYFASVSTPAVLIPDVAAQCRETLKRYNKTLLQMTVDLANSRHYVAVFEALYYYLSRKQRIVQSRRSSPPGSRLDPDASSSQLPEHPLNGNIAGHPDSGVSDGAGVSRRSASTNRDHHGTASAPSVSGAHGSSWAYNIPALVNLVAPMSNVYNSGAGGGFAPGLDNHPTWMSG